MVYGNNLLTNDWTFENGHLDGTSLVLSAGGTATQVITAAEIAIIPEAILLEITSDRYSARYSPQDVVSLEISYNDLSSNSFVMPLAPVLEIAPKSAAKETITLKIKVSQATTISSISLKVPQVNSGGLQEDTSYYGVTIGRDYGLNIEKSDGSSKVILNSDKVAFQALNELNQMVDRIYFDTALGKYVFDGELSADTIEAIKANIDVVISQTIITQTLYASEGRVANLTAKRVLTGDVLSGSATIDYIELKDQSLSLLHGTRRDDLPLIQYTDIDGNPLYWKDETQKEMYTEVTDYPVMVYQYDVATKLSISFSLSDETGNLEPFIILGQGVGNELFPDRGKAFIHKDTEGLLLKYIKADGTEVFIHLGENGRTQSQDLLSAIDFYSNGFSVEYGPEQIGYRWTKDAQGRIIQLENITTSEVIPITWNGGTI